MSLACLFGRATLRAAALLHVYNIGITCSKSRTIEIRPHGAKIESIEVRTMPVKQAAFTDNKSLGDRRRRAYGRECFNEGDRLPLAAALKR